MDDLLIHMYIKYIGKAVAFAWSSEITTSHFAEHYYIFVIFFFYYYNIGKISDWGIELRI